MHQKVISPRVFAHFLLHCRKHMQWCIIILVAITLFRLINKSLNVILLFLSFNEFFNSDCHFGASSVGSIIKFGHHVFSWLTRIKLHLCMSLVRNVMSLAPEAPGRGGKGGSRPSNVLQDHFSNSPNSGVKIPGGGG